jgi:hypothetical protein
MKPRDLVVVEREWASERSLVMQELLQRKVPRVDWPQSLHWDWSDKSEELARLEAAGFGIVCQRRWQGVMLTKTASHVARLAGDKGKPIVYVDYLEIAPWNWKIPEISRLGEYRGVGSVLFGRAVKQSEEEGFHGRVGLHALPQAERFYEEGCGMTPVGRDAKKQNLLYFELSREQAARHLSEGGRS